MELDDEGRIDRGQDVALGEQMHLLLFDFYILLLEHLHRVQLACVLHSHHIHFPKAPATYYLFDLEIFKPNLTIAVEQRRPLHVQDSLITD